MLDKVSKRESRSLMFPTCIQTFAIRLSEIFRRRIRFSRAAVQRVLLGINSIIHWVGTTFLSVATQPKPWELLQNYRKQIMVKYIKHLKFKRILKLHNWLTSYGLRGFYLVVELHQEGSATNGATSPFWWSILPTTKKLDLIEE